MKKLRLLAFTLLLVSTLLLPMRASTAQLDMDDGATSGDLFDRIPPPITDFFIPAAQKSVEPARNPGDFTGQIFAPKLTGRTRSEVRVSRPEAQPITGATVTIVSGPRSGERMTTDQDGRYLFPNIEGEDLHLLVEKEHFEPKEVIVSRFNPTKLASGAVPNYHDDVQQHPGNILIGQRWLDEVRFILEETLVVHDLLYVEGGRLPKGTDLGGIYSQGIVVIYSHQYADRKDIIGLLGTFAHEIAHAHQHATLSIDGSARGMTHNWRHTPEGKAYEEARRKDWEQVGKSQLDNTYGIGRGDDVALLETAAETCAHYWSVDRWGGRTAYGNLRVTAPNRFKWAAVWLPKQSGRLKPLSKIFGDNQTGLFNTPLPLPFAVLVRDDNSMPLNGVLVTFTVVAGGGTLSVTRTTTDRTGIAETTLTLGPNIGTNTVSVSAVGIEGTVTFNAVAEGPVDIPDPNLRAAIKSALGKTAGTPISKGEMATLTRLGARNANISDLTGLEGATNLIGLSLGGNSISDISPVVSLTQLTRLSLWTNSISDISPVAGLTHLTELNLSSNLLSSITSMADLTQLTWLHLQSNAISDISALSGLTELTELRLDRNSITDLSPLVANTGLGLGDRVDVSVNPLSYTSIKTHIPALQNRGVIVNFDTRRVERLLKISGDNQQGTIGEVLADPFVVEVMDERDTTFTGVPVTFAVTAGSGSLSVTNTTTDENGRAASTLTLGANQGTNTVLVSAAGTEVQVNFNATANPLTSEYLWSIPARTSLIHVPLKVTAVNGVAKTITTISDLYDTLGGALTVNFLITYDSQAQGFRTYFGVSDRGTSADTDLTDDTGVIAGLKTPVMVQLTGEALGIDGNSTMTLHKGLNLVGLPLNDSSITRVSDLFALDGIRGNVPVVILTVGGDFQSVGRPGDPADIPITGGQAFIMTAQWAATVTISGEAWTNEPAAVSPAAHRGIKVRDTTPVLALRGAVIDAETGASEAGFRVTVKNLLTGRAVGGVTEDEGAGYRFAVVDMETGRAATVGDTLEISAQSKNPFIGVKPLQYTITAEDVRQSLIQLPELVAYEIPAETQLLSNYPNPFNPETWIPYRLAEDTFVTLTIYDTVGQVVRPLDVGHRIASAYENRSKAIYWDGKNGLGEQVASGVYFYTLTAGDFTATRRMVILK